MKSIKYITLFVAFSVILISNISYCQISKGGKPYSFTEIDLKDSVSTVKMPKVNVDSLLVVDAMDKDTEKPFRFGYAIDVDMDLKDSGTWDILEDGSKIWRLKIYSEEAYSINLIFDKFWLPKESEFFVYNEDKRIVLGAFTDDVSNNEYNKFATDVIQGNTVVLEYYEPANVRGGIINIDKVIHGYQNIFFENNHNNTDFNCHFDINCPEGNDWCVEKRAVSMILVNDNTALCTGCLVNNTSQDLTPYYLTAFHCADSDRNGILSQSEMNNTQTWVFRFKYWSPTCNQGHAPSNWVSTSGAVMRASYVTTDFALLELIKQPPSGFGVLYAGWDRTSSPPYSSTILHYPRGSMMKISFDFDPAVSSSWFETSADSHWKVILDKGTTEGGSSGAPLFNQEHKIVGQNHGGISGCPPVEKKYGRFDVSWTGGGTSATRLRDWLDPDNTGLTTIGATSSSIYLINRTLTGVNKFSALEKLHIEGEVNTNGFLCQPSNVPFTTEYGSNSTFVAKSITIYPGTEFKLGSNVVIETKSNIICNDNIVEGDYVYSFCNAQISMLATDNDILEQYHNESFIEYNDSQNDDNIIAHPNPNDGNLVVEFIKTEDSERIYFKSIIITNLSGRVVYRGTDIDENKNYIDISESPKGVYLMYIETNKRSFIKKIIVK